MDQDRFITSTLDVVIDYVRGALSAPEVLTATIDIVCSYSRPGETNPEVGHVLFETVEALPEAELFVVGVPLVLGALAASGGDYDWSRYEQYVDAAEAALLDWSLSDDGDFLEELAAAFPYGRYALVRPLIGRVLYPYEVDSLR